MPLSDARIRQAKPSARPVKIADGQGLFIEIRPNGSKLWRYTYRIDGRSNLFAIGAYPEVSLADARAALLAARKLVKQGIHPSHERARTRAEQVTENDNTFQAVAREWVEARRPTWSAKYAAQVEHYLERDIYPRIGRRPMRSITSQDVLLILRALAARDARTVAILVRQIISQVFVFAVRSLRADGDPASVLRGYIVRAPVKHADAKPADVVADMMQRLRAYPGNRPTVLAIELLLLTFVRTAELRFAAWSEFDLDRALWTIPAERMKKRRKHLVPLSRQAVAILRELHEVTGANRHLFPNLRRPRDVMSAATINHALERMGFPRTYFTGHDFRATASTHLYEMGYRDELVEMQLAHAKRDKVAAVYNHAQYLPERTTMMQAWADLVDAAVRALASDDQRARAD